MAPVAPGAQGPEPGAASRRRPGFRRRRLQHLGFIWSHLQRMKEAVVLIPSLTLSSPRLEGRRAGTFRAAPIAFLPGPDSPSPGAWCMHACKLVIPRMDANSWWQLGPGMLWLHRGRRARARSWSREAVQSLCTLPALQKKEGLGICRLGNPVPVAWVYTAETANLNCMVCRGGGSSKGYKASVGWEPTRGPVC